MFLYSQTVKLLLLKSGDESDGLYMSHKTNMHSELLYQLLLA